MFANPTPKNVTQTPTARICGAKLVRKNDIRKLFAQKLAYLKKMCYLCSKIVKLW